MIRKKNNKTDLMKRIIQNGVKVHKYQNRQERELNFSKELKGYEETSKEIEKRKERQRELQRQRPMFYQGNGNGK
jgi:hypothetical protein